MHVNNAKATTLIQSDGGIGPVKSRQPPVKFLREGAKSGSIACWKMRAPRQALLFTSLSVSHCPRWS